ncbi:MAG: hypothetical protein R3324_09310 [Halobacteriales archaeon]|nr:hypothetical protein [Halobacteriales archaeon]
MRGHSTPSTFAILAVLVVFTILGGPTAHAVDGVIEINQARALAGGPSDGPGFPVTVSESGSYRLTSDLDVGTTAGGISITAADVTIDLNGFEISTTSGSGNGIAIDSTSHNVEIRNGTVRGFNYGVFLSPGVEIARIVDVRAIGNQEYGFMTQGNGTLVRGCTAADNKSGFRGFEGSLILESIAYGNTEYGMVLNGTAWGSNILSGNNGGNTNPQVNAGTSVQVTGNQCGTSSC